MIKFVRSFLGISSERKVVGSSVNFDMKDVGLIRNSNSRLSALQNLVSRYKNTLHEQKIKLVFEKTKNIHHYLVNKKRLHELELFHIQNTDHFISTFNVIMDVYKSPKESSSSQPKPEIIDIVNKNRESKRFGRKIPQPQPSEKAAPNQGTEKPQNQENINPSIPTLKVPDISLNTLSKIMYKRKDVNKGEFEGEIGFFSTKQDKEIFVKDIASRLNLPMQDIAYVGNAMVNFPDRNDLKHLEYIPVIHWRGFMYGINLKDYRLFPVSMGRKSH